MKPEMICVTETMLEKTQTPDGLILFQPESEKIHHLNATASMVFNLSDGTRSLGAIASAMQEAYALPQAPMAETLACAENLVSLGLLQCKL
nr:PqqD family protein [Aestuariivirga litoralis]